MAQFFLSAVLRTLPPAAAIFLAASLAAPMFAQATPARGGGGASTAPAKSAFDIYIHKELAGALNDIRETGDVEKSGDRIADAFELVISRGTDKQYDLLRDADFAWRLAWQMSKLPLGQRKDVMAYMQRHDALARTMVSTVSSDDSIPDVYDLFDTLRTQRPDQMDAYANLVASLCVVYDVPLTRRINENKVTSPAPLAIFDYYVANEKSMAFGIKNVPPELLNYVVDTTASIDEMKWALAKYAHDPMVGRHFFDIQYDESYFRAGTPKKLDSVPFNLPNILKVGGVCADQAYFAVSIGKAIGVPTAYTHGESAETAHAWVGFLQAQGPKGAWNFDVGRYEEFRGVAGFVQDPQTRDYIPDAFLSYTAEMINATPQARQTAMALSDAAGYMMRMDKPEEFATAELPADAAQKALRHPATADELDLCRQALTQNPGSSQAWLAVASLAKDGKMTFDQKKEWSDELLKRCGAKYPDFALAILSPMIETIDDANKQNTLWNGAFDRFQSRMDLAADIRMHQAAMWQKQKDFQKAGLCYMDVISRYVNAGPFVIDALTGAEQLLRDSGTPEKVPLLYEETWARCQKPQDMAGEFMQESNWYTVGMMLEKRLMQARMTREAAAVQAALAPSGGR